jgi:surface antigen
MRGRIRIVAAALAVASGIVQAPARAADADDFTAWRGDEVRAPDAPYLQCVPYARQVSGIRIFGDAHTWWEQAAGRYERGFRPRVGAVMSFKPYGSSRLGHVAAVSRVIDSRTVLIRHANWSPINGRRGQIEDDVRAVDVSPGNDWSEVRVWFAPLQALGTTHWPLNGFIYPNRAPESFGAPPLARPVLAAADTRPVRRSRLGSDFLKGIAPETAPARAQRVREARRSADPIGDLIARAS